MTERFPLKTVGRQVSRTEEYSLPQPTVNDKRQENQC
jgi:hypothetical protein